jgi:hypothetical protein
LLHTAFIHVRYKSCKFHFFFFISRSFFHFKFNFRSHDNIFHKQCGRKWFFSLH